MVHQGSGNKRLGNFIRIDKRQQLVTVRRHGRRCDKNRRAGHQGREEFKHRCIKHVIGKE